MSAECRRRHVSERSRCSSPPCQASPLCLECATKDHTLMNNASAIQRESGNRRKCIQKLKRPSSLGSNEMHAKGVNVSSKMIIEMGISILGRVNEKLPGEKKIHLAFLTRGYSNFKGGGDLAVGSHRMRS